MRLGRAGKVLESYFGWRKGRLLGLGGEKGIGLRKDANSTEICRFLAKSPAQYLPSPCATFLHLGTLPTSSPGKGDLSMPHPVSTYTSSTSDT